MVLHGFNDLLGFRLVAGDPIGVVTDLLFDPHPSRVRYLRAESEDWLPGGDLLLVPEAVEEIDPGAQTLRTGLSRDALESRPSVERPDAPGPAEERLLHRHFEWTPYWSAAISHLVPYWGAAGDGSIEEPAGSDEPGPRRALRSAFDVVGFTVDTDDGDTVAVEDLILDLEGWVIRYLVVSTGVWLPGVQVLVSPQWLRSIDWSARRVTVGLPRERLESGPTYDRETVLDRGLEEALHRAAGKPGYW